MKKCSVSDLIRQSFKLESGGCFQQSSFYYGCSYSEFDNWSRSCSDCLNPNATLQKRFRKIDFITEDNKDVPEPSLIWNHGAFVLCRSILSEFASTQGDEVRRECQVLVAKESHIHKKFAEKEAYLRTFIPDLKVVGAGFYLNADGSWECKYSGCIPAYVCLFLDGRCFEMHGAICERWFKVRGLLGFPVSDEVSEDSDHQVSHCEYGDIRWSRPSGLCEVLLSDCIRKAFAEKEAYLRTFIPDLRAEIKENGFGIYRNKGRVLECDYSGSTPAHVCVFADGRGFEMHGAIYLTWSCYNVRTRIGFPLSDEESDGPNYQISRYEHGYIRWSRDSGVCDVFMEPSACDYVDAYMKYRERFERDYNAVNYTVHCLPGELENEQSRQ